MKVDVILPVYRGRQWLQEAVESVFAQTFEDWHLWIVDDASPDDSLAFLNELSSSDRSRISTLRLETNSGAATARMAAIERSSGEAIAFLDQDDRWHPEKLALQIECLEQPPTAAVHTDVLHIDPTGQPKAQTAARENRAARESSVAREDSAARENSAAHENKKRGQIDFAQLSPEVLTQALFLENSIRLGSALVLRTAFERSGGFRTDLRGGEDWEFWVRFAMQHSIAHLPRPLLERRIHPGNTSTVDANARKRGALEALRIVEREHPSLRQLSRRRRAFIEQSTAVDALVAKRYSDARRAARALLRLRPFAWRALALFILASAGPFGSPLVRHFLRR